MQLVVVEGARSEYLLYACLRNGKVGREPVIDAACGCGCVFGMILSQREKNIIGYVQHRAEQSVTEIARNLGLTESVVRRSLRRLTDESILVRRAYIDLYRLGFSKHAFFFSLGSRQASARRDVLQYLHKH